MLDNVIYGFLVVFLIIFIIQFGHVIIYIVSWSRRIMSKSFQGKVGSLPGISVVISARNEESNISNILSDLEKQSIDNFEVIVIDDASEDRTGAVLNEFSVTSPLRLRTIKQEEPLKGFSPKKSAIYRGVKKAKYEIIVTTDADCRCGPDWLHSIAARFTDTNCQMVCGPVRILRPHGLLGYLQYLEMAAVMFYSAITMIRNRPTMINGANMAFRKESYLKYGYGEHSAHPSGDDMFLMEQFLKDRPDCACYNLNRAGIIDTMAVAKWKEYLEQRKRWTSKWKRYSLPYTRRLAFTILLFNLNKVLGVTLLFMYHPILTILLPLMIIIILEGVLLTLYLNHFKSPIPFFKYLLLSPVYPFISLFTGISSMYGRYSWKGRRFSVK